jgi:predicted small lipoprotein YifL
MRCYARHLLLAVVATLAFGHILSACGQKGPLYLPGEEEAGIEESAENGQGN